MNYLNNLFAKTQIVESYYSNRLLTKIEQLNNSNLSKANISLITKAILYAQKCHYGQFRETGEPYFCHPLQVAYMVSDFCFKTDIIVTAILHDIIEDTTATKKHLEKFFGITIAQNVMDLTRIKGYGVKITSADLVQSLWKEKKYDLLLVKLFDRLDNIRTIDIKPTHKIKKIIKETRDVFIDLAAYLDMQDVKNELLYICSKHDYLFQNYDYSFRLKNFARSQICFTN